MLKSITILNSPREYFKLQSNFVSLPNPIIILPFSFHYFWKLFYIATHPVYTEKILCKYIRVLYEHKRSLYIFYSKTTECRYIGDKINFLVCAVPQWVLGSCLKLFTNGVHMFFYPLPLLTPSPISFPPSPSPYPPPPSPRLKMPTCQSSAHQNPCTGESFCVMQLSTHPHPPPFPVSHPKLEGRGSWDEVFLWSPLKWNQYCLLVLNL